MSLMVLPLEETIGSGDFDPFLIKGLKYPVELLASLVLLLIVQATNILHKLSTGRILLLRHYKVFKTLTLNIIHASSTTLTIIVNMQNQALGCLK